MYSIEITKAGYLRLQKLAILESYCRCNLASGPVFRERPLYSTEQKTCFFNMWAEPEGVGMFFKFESNLHAHSQYVLPM